MTAMNPHLQIMLQQAIQAFQGGNFDGAELMLKRVLQVDSKNLTGLHVLGLIKASQANYKEAADFLGRAARIDPNEASIQYNLAKALTDSGNDKEAVIHHKKAVALAPNNPEAWLNYGKTASNLGRYEDALVWYSKALSLRPDYAEAALNKGAALNELKRYEEAMTFTELGLAINPNLAEAWSNRGVSLKELKRYEEAIDCYDRALKLKPDYHEAWSNKGVTLYELERFDEAIDCYDRALSLKPDYHDAWSNKGVTLHALKHFDEAIDCYDRALSLKPDYHEAWLNKGVTLNELKHFDGAIDCYDRVLSLKPDFIDALVNKGMALSRSNMPEEALDSYKRAMEIEGDYAGLIGYILHAKLQLCDWTNIYVDLLNFENELKENTKVVDPFLALLLSDNLEVQKKSSEIYAKEKFILSADLGPILKRPAGPKLRLGYFSSDLYYHPVSIWLTEQLEHHDKSQFELFAFSFTQVKDPMRARLENVFDHFIEVDGKSDLEIAQISRTLGIDIAFDLCVYTGEARPGIFAIRAAPIQVSHLGFPGTSGSSCIDYIISDSHALPEQAKQFYTEKIAYVPCAYTYDKERQLGTEILTRAQFGLPQNSFVFTCQNGSYKIMPEVFGIWMDILKAVPGSVLWLMQPNPTATQNLIKSALSHGIESDRLIFTKREVVAADQEKARISRYLASYRLADLFLDTWPYNAGTTAVDALFAGLPVLTKAGASPVSRMATSALNAIEMPELITKTAADYRTLAIELATDPKKLNLIRDKLASNKLKSPLFDSVTNTKYLESAYLRMYERYQADLQPDHIVIT